MKVFSPLNPPVCLIVATSNVEKATAMAWVRMAK